MAIEYKILDEHHLLVASLAGLVDVAAVNAVIRRVSVDPDFVWNLDRLVFVEDKANMSEIDLADLFAIREELVSAFLGGREPDPSELPLYRLAFVVNHLGNEGITRLFASILDRPTSALIDLRTFGTAEEALSWLGHEHFSASDLHEMVVPDMYIPRVLMTGTG